MGAPLAGRVDLAPAQGVTAPMSEWIYFIHPPRDDFAATMTDEERAVWGLHFERFEQALADGTLILVGPTLGASTPASRSSRRPTRPPRRRFMEEDPVIRGRLRVSPSASGGVPRGPGRLRRPRARLGSDGRPGDASTRRRPRHVPRRPGRSTTIRRP